MPNINHTTLGGHLTRDPELRVLTNGTSVCEFAIANSTNYKTKSGEDRESVRFVDVTAWGKTGEIISKFFTKGSPIIVWGKLDMDQWEDKNTGAKRSKLKITVMFPSGGFDFCGKTGDGAGSQNGQGQPASSGPPARSSRPIPPPEDNLDEDVPF